jgi:hypothetical protein
MSQAGQDFSKSETVWGLVLALILLGFCVYAVIFRT